MPKFARAAFSLLAVLGAAPALAEAQAESQAEASAEPSAELSTGLEYQEGDYFTGERVEILSVQNALRLRSGRFSLSASLPWHRISAPGNVVGGGGPLGLPILIDPTRPAARDVRRGLGDLRVGAGYSLQMPAGLELSLTGQVKLPTASASRGIGTGEADFAVGGEASRSFGPVTPFLALGYTMPGDPAGYELRNSLSARGGMALQLSPGLRGTLSYSHADSLNPNLPAERQIGTGLNAALSRSLSLGLYGSAGLSDGAPDVGAGVQIGLRLF